MTDTSFGSSFAPVGAPLDLSPPDAATGTGADVPPVPASQPAAPAPSGAGGLFGSGVKLPSFGGPQYTAPDPNASALDQTADVLQQRIQRANQIATNPLSQFFAPEQAAAARAFVPQATEALQKIKQQKADMQASRVQASTLGLNPGEVPDEATQADRVEVAKSKALQGDLRVFKGLQAVDPQAAAAIQDQVHEAADRHLTNAQLAYDRLSNAPNEGQYQATLTSLRKDGTLTDLEKLGMQVPGSFDAFNNVRASEGKSLREARQAMENLRSKLEERANGTPMEKKEAETYAGRLTTESGEAINNGTWSRINGQRVFQINGAGDIRDLGKKYTLADKDQRAAIHADTKAAVEDKEMEKFRNFNRTRALAVTDEKGNFIPAEGAVNAKGQRVFMNTNPNVQQGVAEGLASMLRGGTGGATSGLLNIETGKRGYVQAVIDKIITNYAGGINTITGDQVKPYLSQLTQEQQRAVLDGLSSYSGKSIADRVNPIARRAGELGLDASALGLGKGEIAGVDQAINEGRQSTIDRFTPRHRATGGGDGGIYLDNPPPMSVTDKPGVQQAPPPVPAPVQKQDAVPPQSPGANPTPGAPTPPAPQAPGGSGPPITVAGQNVNFTPPPGASPAFLSAMQRIESGGTKNPWTATNNKSSAGGAYQFTDATWKENRPPGAPDRAADATPQEQTQAAENFTAKNGQALTAAGLPVNDTNLYVAHNLGAGGASKLLHADPNADARSTVGETAARNNPKFFKGRPTVATVLQRYQAEMNPPGGNKPPVDIASLPDVGAAAWTGRTTPAGDRIATPQERANSPVVEHAPAIGSTAGALAGTVAGGGLGAMAGGGAGGAAGQSFKDWMQGRDQDPKAIAKQGALGAVLGIAPEASPVLGAAARVAGVAGVEGGAKALEGGDTSDVIGAATEGGAYALGGEALGRFITALGPAAHKVLSNYLPSAQKEISAQAGKLAEARAVLETEQPKLAGEGVGPNPKYEAAKKAEEDATQFIKDHGQSPDDMVYAYEQTKAGTSAGEATVLRGANKERGAVSAGYNDLRQQVADTGVGAPKPNQAVPDGPLAQLRTADNPAGKVEEKFRPDAEHAEMLIKAPAQSWAQKWDQLQDAGSELIKKRMAFLANNDKPSADAMDKIFQGVRNQQKAAAAYVFGPERGAQIIKNLEGLDTRYAKVMNATAGMDYGKMRGILASGNTPERRELEKNFAEFAKGDPSAMRAFNAMKAGARGDWKSEAALMGPVIAGEVAANLHGIPTVGAISAAVGAHRLYKLMQGYMNARVLGKAVTFKDFLASEIKNGGVASNAVAGATQRAAVQQ